MGLCECQQGLVNIFSVQNAEMIFLLRLPWMRTNDRFLNGNEQMKHNIVYKSD